MQLKKRVAMKRSRDEASSDELDVSGGGEASSGVPSAIVIEPDVVRNQCQSHSPCTSDSSSDDGEEAEEERVSPPSSAASSSCSGIYYNNNEVRFPSRSTGSPMNEKHERFLPVIIRLPPLRQVPSGRPLPCPPKLALSSGGGSSSNSNDSTNANISFVVPAVATNASISSSHHCDYRKLQATFGSSRRSLSPSSAPALSPLLKAPNTKKNKTRSLERDGRTTQGPPKKRTVSFQLAPEEEEDAEPNESRDSRTSTRRDGGDECPRSSRRHIDLSEDQLLFVEAAATLRQLGRQKKQTPPSHESLQQEAALPSSSPRNRSSMAPGSPVARALPPPPTLPILSAATSRIV